MGGPGAPEDRPQALERLDRVPARAVELEVQRIGTMGVHRIDGVDPVRGGKDHEPIALEQVTQLLTHRLLRLDVDDVGGRGVGQRERAGT